MGRFLLRRGIETAVTLVVISVLTFLLFQLIPGDYLSTLELQPTVSEEMVREMRESLGLDGSFLHQYWSWMSGFVRGDLGYSFAQRRPAFDLIMERMFSTLLLACAALSLALLLGIPAAIGAAHRPGGLLDRFFEWISLVGLSLPSALASVLALYLAFYSDWLPVGGSGSLRHLLLPALVLAFPAGSFLGRTLRVEMKETLQSPFILASIGRGLSRNRVAWKAFRNSANPVVSLSGLTFGGLLSGAVVVERVFGWPGLGSLTLDSILQRDLFVALNCFLVASVLVMTANLMADLILAWNDPRIRYS